MAGLGHWYIEIEKQAFWRGNPHTWVNRYVMSGLTPSASAAATVINALKNIEEQLHAAVTSGAGVGFVEGRAYGATGGPPFETFGYNEGLTPTTATGFAGAGWSGTEQAPAPALETCMMVETPLLGLSTSGKPVSLKKYFRGATYGVDEDYSAAAINPTDQAGITALVLPWQTGLGDPGSQVISPTGRTPAGPPTAHPFIVNHQVPRGRKKAAASSLVGVSGSLDAGIVTMRLPNIHDIQRLKKWQLDNENPEPGVPGIGEPIPFELFP
jgi:hypothetical protein